MGTPLVAAKADAVGPGAPSIGRRVTPAWTRPAAVGAVGLAACVLLRTANPTEEGGTTLCPFKALTGGLDCPGCGATRATNALLHGNPALAADHNALFVALVPLAVLAYLTWAARSVGLRLPTSPSPTSPPPAERRSALRLPDWWLPALCAVTVAFWALRLIPWGPLAWLGSGYT